MIKAFPKIFTLGQDYIKDIFKEEVEITEKIDGSQLDFGKIDNELYVRSKGKEIYIENVDKMFEEGVNYIVSIADKIPNNTIYYCEYLRVKRHNVLSYNRIPKNHIILFGVSDITGTRFISKYNELKEFGDKIDIETVPLLYKGKIESIEEIEKLLDTESVLGGCKIEGIVVKNYNRKFLLGGQPIPLMMGKYVREDYKEVHRKNWKGEYTSKGKWDKFKEGYRTESRWRKAIQHLREKGELENSPRDIGKLLKEIQRDIIEEEKEDIKEFMWSVFGKEVLRYAIKGFPEWYKKELLKRGVEDGESNK